MSALERFAALLASIDTLERQALALVDSLKGGELKAEAEELVEALRRVRTSMDTRAVPQPASLDELERFVAASNILLASLGRPT